MQSPTNQDSQLHKPLGTRRGKSDLARFSLDLSRARVVSESKYTRAYPSPPFSMSGSPPLPPRRNLDASDRGQESYGSSGQDVFRGVQMDHFENRRPPAQGYTSNTGHSVPPAAPSYYSGSYRPDALPHAQYHYPQLPQISTQQPLHMGYSQLLPQSTASFSTSDRPQVREGLEHSSPKQQRKTKGHVASACVPCKKAHLRCDAQRPCSRCLSNGKEDACIDVQHKKRGRPRLRDDRESRYEAPSFSSAHHETSMRRPLSLYSPSEGSGYSDVHRSNSYRVLKSQGGPVLGMGGTNPARYVDHASSADANLYGQYPATSRSLAMQEPVCAYLNMEMQIAKATPNFGEAVGLQSIHSRKLHDIVSPADRDKLVRLQRALEDERREREPNYLLPPIYLAKFEEDRVIQSVGFSLEEIGQARTDRHEMLTFQAPDGQQRTFQLRFGLAKKDSTYFIVALLVVPATPPVFQQPLTSPYSRDIHSRESQYGFQNPQHGYAQSPGMSPYTSSPGFGDPRGEMIAFRPPGPLSQPSPSSMVPQYAPLQARPEYAQAQTPYHTPRSEIQPPVRQDHIQLPPIRAPTSLADPTRGRDERSGRVDIGGLLEKPDPSRRKG